MRVSTDDQTNRNQEIRLFEVVERRGWKIHKIYLDEESGKKRNRPGLNEMPFDAKKEGKKLGRPKIHGSKVRKVHELKEDGMSVRNIAEEVGISKTQVSRILKTVPKTSS